MIGATPQGPRAQKRYVHLCIGFCEREPKKREIHVIEIRERYRGQSCKEQRGSKGHEGGLNEVQVFGNGGTWDCEGHGRRVDFERQQGRGASNYPEET